MMRITIPPAFILPPILILAGLCAGCTAPPPPEPAPVPRPAPAILSPADIERASQPRIDPRWLSDTIAFGTAMLENGAPAAGADVYVAIADGVPGTPGDCGDPRGLHGLIRTSADAGGRWRTPIPRAERGRPGCLFILAEVRDTTGPVNDVVLASGAVGVEVDSVPVHVSLRIVPPPDGNPPWPADPRPDWQWPRVAEHIPAGRGGSTARGPAPRSSACGTPRSRQPPARTCRTSWPRAAIPGSRRVRASTSPSRR
jgi:hypothetical protein